MSSDNERHGYPDQLEHLRRQNEEITGELVRADVRNMDLTHRLRQARSAFEFIAVLNRNIELTFEQNDLFRRVVRSLTVDLNMDSAALLRYHPESRRLEILAAEGLKPSGKFINLPAGIEARAVADASLVNSRTNKDPFQSWLVRRFGNPCLVWRPLSEDYTQPLVLYLGNRYEDIVSRPQFTEEIIGTLGAICSVIHLKLDNIRKTQEMLECETDRRSRESFREFAESLPQPVFEVDSCGRVVFLNRCGLEEFGYTSGELESGLKVFQLVVPECWDRVWNDLGRVMGGRSLEGKEYLGLRSDGRTFPVLVHAGPVLSGDRITVARGIVTDLTENRQLEEQRIRTEKLETVGLLAGGIAHDFNNILMAMLGSLSLARNRLKDHPGLHQILGEAENAGARARELTQQLLTFSRGGAPVRRPAFIPQIIRETARFSLMGSNVQCSFTIAEDLWTGDVDTGQISQVINNLVLNAVQAMPEGGRIRIRAGNAEISSRTRLPLVSGRYIRIAVEDNGAGIPQENLPHIFDPYFTTKENGSGLGLATAYSIVTRHGGCITVNSQPERGSIFTIYLPVAGMDPARENAGSRDGNSRRRKVLLMDDEELVRQVVSQMLVSLGHEVVAVRDGARALLEYGAARDRGAPFDLVIVDLTVQHGLGGCEALNRLREMDPEVQALLSSGYANDPVMQDYREHGFKGVITKPCLIQELRETLERC